MQTALQDQDEPAAPLEVRVRQRAPIQMPPLLFPSETQVQPQEAHRQQTLQVVRNKTLNGLLIFSSPGCEERGEAR